MADPGHETAATGGPLPLWADAPRYVPEVPFPPYRFVPGRAPHPRRDPDGSLYGAPEPEPGLAAGRWEEDRSYLLGVDLYHQGYFWEAHEYWEAVYHAASDSAHRDLIQALIQLAAALLNARLGKTAGVERLAAAVTTRLEAVRAQVPAGGRLAGLDPAALLAAVRLHLERGSPAAPRLELAVTA